MPTGTCARRGSPSATSSSMSKRTSPSLLKSRLGTALSTPLKVYPPLFSPRPASWLSSRLGGLKAGQSHRGWPIVLAVEKALSYGVAIVHEDRAEAHSVVHRNPARSHAMRQSRPHGARQRPFRFRSGDESHHHCPQSGRDFQFSRNLSQK